MVDGEVRVSAADKLAELAEEVREMTAKLRERDRELPEWRGPLENHLDRID